MVVDTPHGHMVSFRELDLDLADRIVQHHFDRIEAIPERAFVGNDEILLRRERALQNVEGRLKGCGDTNHRDVGIAQVKAEPGQYAVYFHCQTNLVETFRELYPELRYGSNRCILLSAEDKAPEAALRHCVALALTYHSRQRKAASGK